MPRVDIEGLDPAEVLFALYRHTKWCGIGQWFAKKAGMSDARMALARSKVVDLFNGRQIYVDFSTTRINTRRYDRASPVPARDVVQKLRKDRGLK